MITSPTPQDQHKHFICFPSFLHCVSLTHHLQKVSTKLQGFHKVSTKFQGFHKPSKMPKKFPLVPKLDLERIEGKKTFVSRDAGLLVPQMVTQMSWKRYNERVLECGCSGGAPGFDFILPHVYLHDSHLYSIDTSEPRIATAALKYSHPNVTYAVGDITTDNFPFKYIKFDKIFSFYTLHFTKDFKHALTRFYDALKPGGEFGFALITNYFCFKLTQKLGTSERWAKFMEDFDQFIPEFVDQHHIAKLLIEKTLRVIGFQVVTVDSTQMEWTFESPESAVEFYVSTSPLTKHIPRALEEEYKKDALALLSTECGLEGDILPGQPCTLKYDVLYSFLRKPPTANDSTASQENIFTKMLRRRSRFSLP